MDEIFMNYIMESEMEEEELIDLLQSAETEEEIADIIQDASSTFTTDVIEEVCRKLQIPFNF